MKLYYSKGACSLVVRIIINEIGIPCDYESVDLKSKKTENGDNFLSTNPKGSVPVIVTDNGDILTENAVILQYLADTYKANTLLPPVSEFRRYRVLEWVNYITTELHKGFGPLFNPNFPNEIKNDVVIPLLKMKLTHVNQALDNKHFLMGDTFTLPDAYLFVILNWAGHFKLDLASWPNLAKFHSELKKRPSVKLSLEEEKLILA